jgi:response regulator of citrate/malate metabolism
MTKGKAIVEHIKKTPGLTNPTIAASTVNCSLSYAKKVFAYLVATGNVEEEINYDGRTIYFYIGL